MRETGEETQELAPEDRPEEEKPAETGEEGEKYDGGEIPPAPADAE